MIIGLTGLAQSGKDTVAQFLIDNYGYERRAFADKLKDFALDINPTLKTHVEILGWELAKKLPENRKFLQDLGHNARIHFGEDFWVDQVFGDESFFGSKIVISDMRYWNEFQKIKLHSGILVRINRPGLELVNNHVTETGHLNWEVDVTIENSGTLEYLYAEVKEKLPLW